MFGTICQKNAVITFRLVKGFSVLHKFSKCNANIYHNISQYKVLVIKYIFIHCFSAKKYCCDITADVLKAN